MTVKIDGARALELLTHQVRDHEDFEYKSPEGRRPGVCVYQFEGCPSCLIGKALAEAGVPLEALKHWDKRGGSTPIAIAELPEGFEMTAKARRVFASAQATQDRGDTWGQALQAAIQAAYEFGPEV